MKRAIFFLSVLMAAFTFSACSGDDNAVENNTTIKGGVPVKGAPTDWVVAEESDVYPKNMLVLIDETGLPTELTEGDMVAAFVNGVCRAVSTPLMGTEGYNRFQFKINLPTKQVVEGSNYVELRYYSDKHKLVFTSESIKFAEETLLGEYMNGYKPVWKK